MLQYGFTGKISEFLQFWQTKNRQQDKKVRDYRFFLFEILKAFNDNNPNCIHYSCEIKDDCHAFTGT